MVKVYSSPNVTLVYHFKNVLETHGIACDVRHEFLVGTLVPGTERWPELWVADDAKIDQARGMIRQAARDKEPDAESWVCAGCGELIEAQFTKCWRCGGSSFDNHH